MYKCISNIIHVLYAYNSLGNDRCPVRTLFSPGIHEIHFLHKAKVQGLLEPVVLGKFWLSKQDTPTKRGPVQGDPSPLQSI